MSARERILMIRLIEKAGKHPAFAKKLVIEVAGTSAWKKEKKPTGLISV